MYSKQRDVRGADGRTRVNITLSLDLGNGMAVVDLFRIYWQSTEGIIFQEHPEHPTEAGVYCYVLKWVGN